MKLVSVFSTFGMSLLLSSAAAADSGFGMSSVLLRLSEMHGDYRVDGRMSDGIACEISVHSSPTEFRFTFNDNIHQSVPLEVLTLVPSQRMVYFEISDTPTKRTLIKLRDRVPYPGSLRREVDVNLVIEESPDSDRVFIIYEDKIKNRRYVCQGPKTPQCFDLLKSQPTMPRDYL